MVYNVTHFKLGEFACRCCGRVEVAAALALWLEILRRAWGGAIHVNSGYRCLRHNTNVGGSISRRPARNELRRSLRFFIKTSRHMLGCAADIRPSGPGRGKKMDTKFMYLAHRLFDGIPGREYVKYSTYLHVAVPRVEAGTLWSGNAAVNIDLK